MCAWASHKLQQCLLNAYASWSLTSIVGLLVNHKHHIQRRQRREQTFKHPAHLPPLPPALPRSQRPRSCFLPIPLIRLLRLLHANPPARAQMQEDPIANKSASVRTISEYFAPSSTFHVKQTHKFSSSLSKLLLLFPRAPASCNRPNIKTTSAAAQNMSQQQEADKNMKYVANGQPQG